MYPPLSIVESSVAQPLDDFRMNSNFQTNDCPPSVAKALTSQVLPFLCRMTWCQIRALESKARLVDTTIMPLSGCMGNY
jgi:hypothetical protein